MEDHEQAHTTLHARLREAHKDCDHAAGPCERMDVAQAQTMLADKVDYYLRLQREAEPANVAGDTEPTEPARRTRKPTLASVARQAAKARLEVAAYEVKPDGSIAVIVGKPAETKPDASEWDGVLLQ